MANQTADELMAEGRDDKGIQVRRGEAGRGATGSGWAPFELLGSVVCVVMDSQAYPLTISSVTHRLVWRWP